MMTARVVRARFSRQVGLALLVSFTLVLLHALVSQGSNNADFPLPANLPVPDAVLHTDAFGHALALDGDILVVGAPYTTVGGHSQQGAAYVYTRNPADPHQFTLLKQITGSENDVNSNFGWTVDVAGDTVVVGAYKAVTGRGAVHVFQRDHGGPGNWGEVKRIVRDDNRSFTDFGRSVALHGDTLMVGAPLGLGEVLVYQRNLDGADNWGQAQTLTAGYASIPTAKVAGFGDTLAFDGSTLAVGATRESVTQGDLPAGSPAPAANFSGAVYVFRLENGAWVREAKLFSSDVDVAGNWYGLTYGASLALNGDLLFVGETGGRAGGIQTGKAHIYQRGGGTPGTVGAPGPWGLVTALAPADGVAGDLFGQAIYAVNDGLFVSAKKQGIGKVYFFRNPAQPGTAGASTPESTTAWGSAYSFTTSTGAATTFGLPIAGDSQSILVGESSANDGRGGIGVYAAGALFAYDPNSTPTPPPTATPTPTPTATPIPAPGETVACAFAAHQIYLPVMANRPAAGASQAHAAAPARPAATTVTAILAPGCTVEGPAGMKLAASSGAISDSVAITIAVAAAPAAPLPPLATVRGEFLHLAAGRDRLAPMEAPFIVAIPVPAGADVTQLVLLHTTDDAQVLDGDPVGTHWGYLPGVYDAATNLFLARLPFLLAEGATFALADHPSFASPPNPTDVAAAHAAAQSFDAWCMLETFGNETDCTSVQESAAAQLANEIYGRMTETFGYPKALRLLDTSGQFIVNQALSIRAQNANYAVHLVAKSDPRCVNAAGFYNITSGFLALCLRPNEAVDGAEKETLIHEMFHAFQFSYPLVMQQWEDGREQQWAIEGMAEAAVKSYPETAMKRSPFFGADNLKDVDRALTAGIPDDNNVEEYLAQDFWVYVGSRHGAGLEYLHRILAIGGVNATDLEVAFATTFFESFKENYWGWVKNQAIENIYDVGLGTGATCELSKEALFTTRPAVFEAGRTYWPYDTGAAFDRLPPLTARVIEIKFGTKPLAIVHAGYRDCVGLTGELAQAACKAVARLSLRVKIYEESEAQCWNEVLPGADEEGVRLLTNLSEFKRYFVVVANVNLVDEQSYFLAIE